MALLFATTVNCDGMKMDNPKEFEEGSWISDSSEFSVTNTEE